MKYRVQWCPLADGEHKKSRRQYAHTFHRRGSICIARSFLKLPKRHKIGIILHEIGHLLAGRSGSEADADRAAEGYFQVRIRYTNSRYGESLQYVDRKYFGVLKFER